MKKQNEFKRSQKDALVLLMTHKGKMKRQEYSTLKGLIYSGDVEGMMKGLEKISRRNEERKANERNNKHKS